MLDTTEQEAKFGVIKKMNNVNFVNSTQKSKKISRNKRKEKIQKYFR